MEIAGVQYSLLSQAEVVSRCERWIVDSGQRHIVTLNPEMVVEAQHNAPFAQAVAQATLRIPDGSGLLWAAEYITGNDRYPWKSLLRFSMQRNQKPVPGVDLLGELARLCQLHDTGLFLLGGEDESNNGACQALKAQCPQLRIAGFGGGMVDINSPEEVLRIIRSANPAVLAVAYGVPTQTLWIERHLLKLPGIKIAIGVGGALDMWAHITPRAPQWIRKHHLEWAWRWGLEPSRWKRIVRATWSFGRLVQKEKRQN